MPEDKPEQKNKGGRPLKFKTVKGLRNKIREYFASCFKLEWQDEERRDPITGEWILDDNKQRKIFHIKRKVQVEPFTITGLALFLNTSRETLMNYEKRDEFFDTVKHAKTIVEKGYETRLIERGNSGDIFGLQNFNWKAKKEIDLTSGGEKIPTPLLVNLRNEVPDSNSDKEDSEPN